MIEDITDLKQAEETQRLLAEAGRVLAGSLDYEETLRSVAWLAVPGLADWCTVDVVGDHGLERVAVAHATPRTAGWPRGCGAGSTPAARSARRPSCAAGAPSCIATSTRRTTARPRCNPAHLEAMLQIGARSNASVPMTVRGERLGVITLSTAESGRMLGPEQLSVLEELGRRAAVAVDSARVHRQRSAIARTLQNSLLPPALPEIAGRRERRRCTARPARATTSAATSTTSSASPTTSGSP